MPFPWTPGQTRRRRRVVRFVRIRVCDGIQSEAVEYFEKNIVGEHFNFGVLLDLACTVQASQPQSTLSGAVCYQYVPPSFRLRDPRRSVTVRPSFRVTSSIDIRPTLENIRRVRTLTTVTTPRGDKPLTIPILCQLFVAHEGKVNEYLSDSICPELHRVTVVTTTERVWTYW